MGATFNLIAKANQDGKHLCVGLDPNPSNIAKAWGMSGMSVNDHFQLLQWGRYMVEATGRHAAAYKANGAFWADNPGILKDLFGLIRKEAPNAALILDAKYGDIDSTGSAWAGFGKRIGADAVTVNPYMGLADVTAPFLAEGLDCFVLGKTSNPNAGQFQSLLVNGPEGAETLADCVVRAVHEADTRSFGVVSGATDPAALAGLSKRAPVAMFLIPGVGSQGGDLERVVATMHRHQAPWVVNVGRAIAEPSCAPGDQHAWKEAVARAAGSYAARMRI